MTEQQASETDMPTTDSEWAAVLTPEQFAVLRTKGTEAPFTGELLHNSEDGVYACGACGQPLFGSDTKFDSGTGWPSFFQPITDDAISYERDVSHGMVRTEVSCSNCGGHLGHVFDDGPRPTGQRFCINSLSLGFNEGDETSPGEPSTDGPDSVTESGSGESGS